MCERELLTDKMEENKGDDFCGSAKLSRESSKEELNLAMDYQFEYEEVGAFFIYTLYVKLCGEWSV